MQNNGANSYLFVNSVEIRKFKARDSEINAIPLYLGNISKDFSVDNMKKTGFYGYVYDFSVDYDFVAADDILDIHKCLMKKNNVMKNVWIYQILMLMLMMFIGRNVSNVNPLIKNNQEFKKRPEIRSINSNESSFYPYSISCSKSSGSCHNINGPYAKLCVPDVVKNINVKEFNLISRNNKTRQIE